MGIVKAVFFCLLFIGLTPLAVAGSGPFDLLPNDHWSYDALVQLSKTPLLSASDTQFADHVEITRFEVALLVAKILDNIEKLGTTSGLGPDASGGKGGLESIFQWATLLQSEGYLTSEHLRLIRKLATDFREELRDLGVEVKDLQQQTLEKKSVDLVSLEKSLLTPKPAVLGVDSTVHSTDSLTIGTKIVKRLEEGAANKSMAAVAGSVKVGDAVRVRGEYAGNPNDGNGEAITIGASVDVGSGVILGVDYKTIQAGFDPVSEEDVNNSDRQGYNLYLKVGDLLLNTERLQVSTERLETITSWGLVYDISGKAKVKAGYKIIDITNLQEADDNSSERVAELGLDLPVYKDSLIRIGLNYVGTGNQLFVPQSATAGVKYTLPGSESAVLTADLSLEGEGLSKKTTTSFTFDYNLKPDASLTLGYRLIDFDDLEGTESQNANVAMAEFTLRF